MIVQVTIDDIFTQTNKATVLANHHDHQDQWKVIVEAFMFAKHLLCKTTLKFTAINFTGSAPFMTIRSSTCVDRNGKITPSNMEDHGNEQGTE